MKIFVDLLIYSVKIKNPPIKKPLLQRNIYYMKNTLLSSQSSLTISMIRAIIKHKHEQINALLEIQASVYSRQYNGRILYLYEDITLLEKLILDKRLDALKKRLS